VSDIVVVGSLNMDIVTRVHRFPIPGETLHAMDTTFFPGGKGANQAAAAARLGASASVAMVGAVGADAFGKELTHTLSQDGINVCGVHVLPDVATGVASITVDADGRNSILVSAGANVRFRWQDAAAAKDAWDGCHVVLLQNEIAPETLEAAILSCAERGIRVLYNPAPAAHIDALLLRSVDTLILNEYEAEVVTGIVVSDDASAEQAATALVDRGVRQSIITLGENGLLYRDRDGTILRLPAFSVHVVDTTAAGDTFIGAYAVAVVEGQPLEEALKFASAAAALSVTRAGAQSSIPTRDEAEAFLERQGKK